MNRSDAVEHQRDELGLDCGRHRPDCEVSFLKLCGVNLLTLFGVCSGLCGSLLNCQRRREIWLWRGSVCSFRI